MPKIRQEINILNREFINVHDQDLYSDELINFDPNEFNDISAAYLEVVATNDDSSYTPGVELFTDGGSPVGTILYIPINTLGFTRFRSTDISNDADFANDTFNLWTSYNALATGTLTIKSAKIIILQDATDITDTQTQIEVGGYQIWADVASAETYEPLSEPKYWKYESAKWDPTPTFTLGFTALNENDADTSRVALQESSDAAFTSPSTVTNSVVSFTSETIAYYESAAFTPTDGYYYRLAYTNNDTMYGGTIYNAKVIATQEKVKIAFDDDLEESITFNLSDTTTKIGQCFSNSNVGSLTGVQWRLEKNGSPTGNVYCKLYACSGTVGTNAVATGSPLATATTVLDVSTLTTSPIKINFEFAGYSLSASTDYVITVEYDGGDTTNRLEIVLGGNPDGTYNRCKYTTSWVFQAQTPIYFKVFTESITKLQPEYLLINAAQTDTGLQEFQTYYDPAEWDGVNNTYYHEHSAGSSSSNTKLQTDLDTTPADITNSSITGDDLTRGGSALTMPSTSPDFIYKNVHDQGSYYTGVWGDGTFVFAGAGATGLVCYTVDGSGNFTYKDSDYRGSSHYKGVWGDGTYIYVACGNDGIRSYTVDGSGNLTYVDVDYQSGDYRDVWGDGTYIYVASETTGLRSYSQSSGIFTHEDVDDQGGDYIGVWGDGTFIYVACSFSGIRSYSADGSGNLTHITQDYQGANSYENVWGDGTYIYVTNSGEGIRSYSFDIGGIPTAKEIDSYIVTA